MRIHPMFSKITGLVGEPKGANPSRDRAISDADGGEAPLRGARRGHKGQKQRDAQQNKGV